MKYLNLVLIACLIWSCNNSGKKTKPELEMPETVALVPEPTLNVADANNLAELPIHCIQTEYPNKLNQTIGSDEDLKSPKALHPAFYGCFDWHSAVHGHWSLVSLLKQFPDLGKAEDIKKMLLQNISEANIKAEVNYFYGRYNSSYERTYGWAWVLKLAEELHTWDDPTARTLEANLQPLTDLIAGKYIEFLPKLNYPIRVGEHTNTAFGLSFAYDYAQTVGHEQLKQIIAKRAKDFYLNDKDCALGWEPSGFDFLSPCFEEAALMKRVLPTEEYKAWLSEFLPDLSNPSFTINIGVVTDRSDGKLVHLDGVNFSRAWSLNEIAHGLPAYAHLNNIANRHINHSLPNLVDDSYEGGHWLGSFAIYALNSIDRD